MKLYNSLTRTKEVFTPIVDGRVSMYTCGPTVYNYAHIGNFRAYITADILKRALQLQGHQVTHVMNLTDVDDKTIRDSQTAGEDLGSFTEKYTTAFFTDLEKLQVSPADHYPKATEYIKPMLILIEKLLEKECAYVGEDGSVYFAIDKDSDYGKLSHLEKDMVQKAKSRIANDEYGKDAVQDFALWKVWDEADGDVFWEPEQILGQPVSFGKGRPGWHIECSAMSMDLLGVHFDIHTGGVDLLFPHHENEIAQSQCATGQTFVNYWVHNEHVMVDGKKMSKSLGNAYTLQDLEGKGFDPIAYRYLTLQTHYRQKMNFTWEALGSAAQAYKKLVQAARELDISGGFAPEGGEVELAVFASLFDDLNTAEILADLHILMKSSRPDSEKAALLAVYDEALGLDLSRHIDEKEDFSAEVMDLLARRERARATQDWGESDHIRSQLEQLGYDVQDTEEGQNLRRRD